MTEKPKVGTPPWMKDYIACPNCGSAVYSLPEGSGVQVGGGMATKCSNCVEPPTSTPERRKVLPAAVEGSRTHEQIRTAIRNAREEGS